MKDHVSHHHRKAVTGLLSGVLMIAKAEFSKRSHQSSINLIINSPLKSTEKPLEKADSEETIVSDAFWHCHSPLVV